MVMRDSAHNKLSCVRGHVSVLPYSCLLIQLLKYKPHLFHQFWKRHREHLSFGVDDVGPILNEGWG